MFTFAGIAAFIFALWIIPYLFIAIYAIFAGLWAMLKAYGDLWDQPKKWYE